MFCASARPWAPAPVAMRRGTASNESVEKPPKM